MFKNVADVKALEVNVTALMLMFPVATTLPLRVICVPLNEMLVVELPNAKLPVEYKTPPEPVIVVLLIAAVLDWLGIQLF